MQADQPKESLNTSKQTQNINTKESEATSSTQPLLQKHFLPKFLKKRSVQIGGAILLTAVVTFSATNYWNTGLSPWESLDGDCFTLPELQKIQRAFTVLNKQYMGNIDREKMINSGIEAMTKSLGDPYTAYLQEEDSKDLDQTMEANFEGIGAQISSDHQEIVVISPIKGSPAEKAGIQPHDVLVSADGQSLSGKTPAEAAKMIRGEAGSEVQLVVRRGDSEQSVTIKRGKVPLQTVHSEKIADHPEIGYIQISTFSEPTAADVRTAVTELRKQGVKSFIVDVRGNPGGLLTSAVQIANFFLKKGQTIVQVENKEGQRKVITAGKDSDFHIDEPTVLLVDKGSASASEILAGALKESAHLPIVGTQTYGKGTVQTVFKLDPKDKLKVTYAHWLTPDGHWIHKKGIQPDEPVELPDYATLHVIDTQKEYHEGDEGDEVKNIQKFLQALGKLQEDQVTSHYDANTQKAVKEFQKENHLSQTATINQETALKLIQVLKQTLQANDQQKQKAVDLLRNH